MESIYGNESKLEAQKYNYFSPNISSCIVDYQSDLIHFHTMRFCGSDLVSGRAIFRISDLSVVKISPYERVYLKNA